MTYDRVFAIWIRHLKSQWLLLRISTALNPWTGSICGRRVFRTAWPSYLWPTKAAEATITTLNIFPTICGNQLSCILSVWTGRKRQWFKVDEAIQVLQSHKPVHAEYLRRLTNSRSPACTSVCSTTNGNMQSSEVMDNNTPCYVFCSSQSSDVVNR